MKESNLYTYSQMPCSFSSMPDNSSVTQQYNHSANSYTHPHTFLPLYTYNCNKNDLTTMSNTLHSVQPWYKQLGIHRTFTSWSENSLLDQKIHFVIRKFTPWQGGW